jgi:hypothetical protein
MGLVGFAADCGTGLALLRDKCRAFEYAPNEGPGGSQKRGRRWT